MPAFAAESIPAVASPEIRVPDDVPLTRDLAGGAICWLKEAGFVISLPEGWQHEPRAAEHFHVCLMGIPAGTHFNDSPAVLYPRIFARSADQTPAQAADDAAQLALQPLSRAPDGKHMTVRAGEGFTTAQGLPVEVRYFDNGPYPNKFEATAYVTYHTATLVLILSAKTRQARDTFLPALLEVAREMSPMQVIDKRNHTEK